MNLTGLLQKQRENSGEGIENINLLVAKALIFVVENFLLSIAPSFVLTISCRNNRTCKFYDEMLDNLFRVWDSPPIQIVDIAIEGTIYVPGRRHSNLILVDSYEAFRAIDVISYTAEYNHNEYYYILLQMRDRFLPAEMKKIFEYCWKHYLINCNIQIQTAKGEILVYTYYPFTEGNCENTNLILINEFNGTSMINDIFFPKKLTNFYGCSLRIATWDVPPFLYLQKLGNTGFNITHGIEGRVVLALAEKLNFSIEVRVPPENSQRGIIIGKNLTGALLMLEERTADFSLGCFRLAYDRALVSTATFSHYQSSQVICLPIDAYTLSSLDILLFPFTASTWITILFICGVSAAFIFILNKYYKRYPNLFPNYVTTHSYLNVFLMAVGMASTLMPQRHFARFLCTNWMLFTLILRTAYQALLFHLIRTQAISHVPQTVEDLVDDNFTVVVNHGTYLALVDVQFLKEIDLYVMNTKEETVAFEFIDKFARKRLVAAGPLDFLVYYGIEEKRAGAFRILREHLLTLPLTMYTTKHSFLIDQLDEDLMAMRSTGLVNKWADWELDVNYIQKSQLPQNKIFALDELYMLFVFGFIGLSVATGVFLLELLSLKIKHLKNIFTKI